MVGGVDSGLFHPRPLEHWARSAQNSGDEVEDDEDTSVLIPWLDLLNHSSNRPTASARWVPQASVYEVQALCKMEAGEAVFLSYGGEHDRLQASFLAGLRSHTDGAVFQR